jgi:hypothetical protein
MQWSLVGSVTTTLSALVFTEVVLLGGLGGIIGFWIARIEPSGLAYSLIKTFIIIPTGRPLS